MNDAYIESLYKTETSRYKNQSLSIIFSKVNE